MELNSVLMACGCFLGGALCLAGFALFWRSFLRSSVPSKEPLELLPSPLATRLDGMETRLAEAEAQAADALRRSRELELEWVNSSEKLRSMVGRLDKRASLAAKDGTGPPPISEAEMIARARPR